MALKKIFTADSFIQLQQLKQLLDENQIECMTKGETSMASGAAAGELPPALIKNTLHIFNEEDERKALAFIEEYQSYTGLEKDWTCPNCKEHVEKNFAQCWNCGTDYPS